MNTRLTVGLATALAACAATVFAQELQPELRDRIDASVADVMAKTRVPSASLGVVRNGGIIYMKAYGQATLDPPVAATPAMHYPVGSISKQFTAACLLLLQQEGRLSLDDPIAKYLPELTRAGDVTIRHLLSHTSGYQDYAPQDYTIPEWTRPTTADKIVHDWATKPLDFEPGTEYQYSNTNFNIAGLIVEKVSGETFWSFLSARVLRPLGLVHTIDLDTDKQLVEPTGYMRHALGPLRPALLEAPGWYFADGELAMPVNDLLLWDISLLNRSLLAPASYAAMETEVILKDGRGAGYGLGLGVSIRDGHRLLSHGGEVGGFVAQNLVFPDDKVAVAVLTNQEASAAAGAIARAVSRLVLPAAPAAAAAGNDAAQAEAQARQILARFQQGAIDRALFTANCNFYFNETAIADYQNSLSPLGTVTVVTQTTTSLRGGMRFRAFDIVFTNGTKVRLTTYTTLAGKIEQFLVDAVG